MKASSYFLGLSFMIVSALGAERGSGMGQLHFGWATISITPDQPVAIAGQYHTRISGVAHDPVQATALAIETKNELGSVDQAVLVSCDLVGIRKSIQTQVREQVAKQITELDPEKIFLTATHSHTSPALTDSRETNLHPHDFMGSWAYRIPPDQERVMLPRAYGSLLVARLSRIVIEAWNQREPGGMSTALGHALVARNRRAVYADGTARMYGGTEAAGFSHLEGGSDHAVDLVCFWRGGTLRGLMINVSCPSQEVEGETYLSADFWYDTRRRLRERFSADLNILSLCGAAGDQSPHLMWNRNAEGRLRDRAGRSPRQEIAHRLLRAVEEAMPRAEEEIHRQLPFEHRVQRVPLPVWKVSDERYAEARNRFESGKNRTDELASHEYIEWRVSRTLMNRFEHQKEDPHYHAELHFLRLGDLAIATNPFELYTDYGIRIKARSPARQTMIIQLAAACGGYLPTERAVAGGGYSARIVDGVVGPQGGDVLVEQSARVLSDLWQGSH